MGVAEDRISELPDPLLLHIFSFLPTKSVVSTSILSKRWRYLYISIPILDFRGWQRPFISAEPKLDRLLITEEFMNSVDRFLSDDVIFPINIQKFCLCVNDYFDESRVSRWITTLISRRKIEHLNLSIDSIRRDFVFPPCFFNSETLITLELERYAIRNLPESISFPSLKILRLEGIKFIREDLIEQFVSNCPVLEELIMSNCSWMGLESSIICISAPPSLKCLNITGSSYYRSKYNRLIKIHAPNLQSFTYIDSLFKDYVVDNFSSLAYANFDITEPPGTRYEVGFSASKLLAGISNVKLLKLSNETLKVISFSDDPLTNLPTFYNLIHLEVTTTLYVSNPFLDFLWIAPNLESLVFAEGVYRILSDAEFFRAKKSLPECLLLHLKVVEFREFHGRLTELEVINFFLKNAKVLERMTILSSSTLPTNMKNYIRENLKSPKGLTSCVVNLL